MDTEMATSYRTIHKANHISAHGSMDTKVATSHCTTKKSNIIYHVLNTIIQIPHGSMDAEVATSYCTTNEANSIYHILKLQNSNLPRKYGHRGGNLILHD